jgi:predicted hydrocarbon binding protein
VSFRIRRDTATIEVRSSIFCQVREAVEAPLCGFYEGLVLRLLAEYGLEGRIRIVKCRAAGGQTCDIELADLADAPPDAAEAVP